MIRILLVDDQFLILETIKAILKDEPEIEIVGTAQDGQIAISQVKKLRPDILLMDIEMPKMNGITATKYICKYVPDTKIIVMTSHSNQDYIAEALLAGASGYLLKNSLIKDLKQAIYSFGISYSDTKAKLLTKAVRKNYQTNVLKYQQRIIYLKKYRKNIYKPTVKQKKQQLLCKNIKVQLDNLGTTKARLTPILKPPTIKEIPAINLKTYSLPSIYSPPPRFNRRNHLRRIIWLLLVIFSIVLSIIIF